MASVSRRIPPEIRDSRFHWRTHKAVAALDREAQIGRLQVAAEQGMTSDEVQRAIRTNGSEGSQELEDPIGGISICPACERSIAERPHDEACGERSHVRVDLRRVRRFEPGREERGAEVVAAVEIDAVSTATHRLNAPATTIVNPGGVGDVLRDQR